MTPSKRRSVEENALRWRRAIGRAGYARKRARLEQRGEGRWVAGYSLLGFLVVVAEGVTSGEAVTTGEARLAEGWAP